MTTTDDDKRRHQDEAREKAGPPPARLAGVTWLVVLAVFGLGWLWWSHAESKKHTAIDYTTLYQWAEQSRLARVTLKGRQLDGKLREPVARGETQISTFRTELPEHDDTLLPLLRARGTEITIEPEQAPFASQVLLSLLPWILIIGGWAWFARRAKGMVPGGTPFGDLAKSKGRRFEKETAPGISFGDVAGLEGAKRDLQEIVQFLKNPTDFRRLGAKVPRGVLLLGPPGTGKTLLARAVAGESGVPFFSVNASEFVEMFVGLGAARVRDLFQEAKKSAPAIVFIDEIDAVGRTRGAGLGVGHDEREQTLNQLLAEMDGFSREQNLVVLAATNRPDVLDPALLRPGRFDRRVVVERPELPARRAIVGVHTKGKPLAPDVDLDAVARNTVGFSGADLANLVNEAAIGATRRGAEAIAAADFAAAYDKIVLGDPRELKLGPEERRRVAVHEAGHAVVARFLPGTEALRRVSILPRGMALGATQQAAQEDRHLVTRAELRAKLAVMMGGYAAEETVLGDISTGAENDLKQATEVATHMVAHYGMSERLGPIYYEHRSEHPFLGQRIATDGGTSDATAHAIEDETRRLMTDAVTVASAAVIQHRATLDRLVAGLLDKETLEGGALDELLGPVNGSAGAGLAVVAASARPLLPNHTANG